MTASTPIPETIVRLRLEEVHAAPDNVRAAVGDVTELAASIASVGVIEPLIVVPSANGPTGGIGGYTVVVGHRRLAGAKLAGSPTVPAIIRQLDERARVEAMLVENLQREDLTPLEEAEAYRRLLGLGIGQIELAKRIGRSQAHVSKRLSLLKLPDVARTAVAAGAVTIADALELVEYAADPEVVTVAVKELAEATKRGGYRAPAGRIAESVKQQLGEDRARKTALEGLAAAKVSILKTDQYGNPAGHPIELGDGFHSIPMRIPEHKVLGCHAAYVDGRGKVHYVCTKPATHVNDPNKAVAKAAKVILGQDRGPDTKTSKAAQKKAAETRERNKVLKVATPIRRKLAGQLLRPSKVRREALDFAIRQLIQTVVDTKPELSRIAAELLEVKPKDRDGRPSFKAFGSPAQIDKLAYALGLAAGEAPFVKLAERSYFDEEYSSHAARYFAHLKAANYKATPTELAQIKPSGWRGPFDK